MIFNSSAFLIFALVFFSVYVFLQGRSRTYVLLIASYFFYGWWDWRYLGLIFVTTAVDFWAGQRIAGAEHERPRRFYLWLSLGLNLLVLFVFKYFDFFSSSLDTLVRSMGWEKAPWLLEVALPVGISFYTFQSMAYTIDVYRRAIPPERNLIDFAAFVAFFPQLVAGPIERAGRLLPQIRNLPWPDSAQVKEGAALVVWGYFQKVFIADNMARIVNIYFDYGRDQSEGAFVVPDAPNSFFLNDPKFDQALSQMQLHLTAPEIGMCLLAFALQVYGDFAGYSNIARGLAKFLGVEIMVNFRQPYLAVNPSDFWRRWHISLSTWFRDYVYIPLGGNRAGRGHAFRNVLLVMLAAGLWHGAAWNFVIWGAYWGLLLGGYHVLKAKEVRARPVWRYLWAWPVMFAATLLGWLMFRSSSGPQLLYFINKLFTNVTWPPPHVAPIFHVNLFWVIVFSAFIISVDLFLERTKRDCPVSLDRPWGYAVAVLLVWLTVVYGGQSEQFIYFRF